MTKEITKAIILQQMKDRLKLREWDRAKFLFLETVTPTYDIGQHLKEWWTKYSEQSITASGVYVFFTVPETEQWELHRYDVVFMGAGAYTVSGVYVKRRKTDPSAAFIYLDLKAAQAASYHTDLKIPAHLDSGDELRINVDGYTSTQNLRLYIDYLVKEIR